MAAAVVVLLGAVFAWLAVREPPEIGRSRALRLGMTQAEVEAVMGQADEIWTTFFLGDVVSAGGGGSNLRTGGLLFGSMLKTKMRVRDWFGLKKDSFGLKGNVELNDWPVRVRLDENGRVVYIRRGQEVVQP
jgi:hypothetical protein